MAIINAGPAERRNDLNLYLTAFFFALLRMVILSAKCHANQCETFRRATILSKDKSYPPAVPVCRRHPPASQAALAQIRGTVVSGG